MGATTALDVDDLITRAKARRSLPEPAIRKLIRERAGLSQSEIAAALGVQPSAVSRWEAGLRCPRGKAGIEYMELISRLGREVL